MKFNAEASYNAAFVDDRKIGKKYTLIYARHFRCYRPDNPNACGGVTISIEQNFVMHAVSSTKAFYDKHLLLLVWAKNKSRCNSFQRILTRLSNLFYHINLLKGVTTVSTTANISQ